MLDSMECKHVGKKVFIMYDKIFSKMSGPSVWLYLSSMEFDSRGLQLFVELKALRR